MLHKSATKAETVMWPTKRIGHNIYKLVLCIGKYTGRERDDERKQKQYISIYIHGNQKKKKKSQWVTVLPIWTGMCLVLEVKGQRATFNSAIFRG